MESESKFQKALTETIKMSMLSFISNDTFVNALNDYGAFKDEPAFKYILKNMTNEGMLEEYYKECLYPRFIGETIDDEFCQNHINTISHKLVSQFGFQESLVDELLSALLLAFSFKKKPDSKSKRLNNRCISNANNTKTDDSLSKNAGEPLIETEEGSFAFCLEQAKRKQYKVLSFVFPGTQTHSINMRMVEHLLMRVHLMDFNKTVVTIAPGKVLPKFRKPKNMENKIWTNMFEIIRLLYFARLLDAAHVVFTPSQSTNSLLIKAESMASAEFSRNR